MNLNAKTALVTGGNRGIGFEVCRLLAQRGARVLLGSRDSVKGKAAAEKLRGQSVEPITIDTSDIDSIRSALQEIKGDVDILVNNAAILDHGRLFSLAEHEIDYIVKTNLVGPMVLARELGEKMRRKKWGRIVNVTSGMGSIHDGLGGQSVIYRVTKLALNGLTICLAQDLSGSGVLVNSVDPGWVRTEMGGPNASKTPEEGAEGILFALLLPDKGPTGKFFRSGREAHW